MNFKKKIISILLLALWITISGGVLVLLVAASQIKSSKNCRGIEVDITGVEEFYFLDNQDILGIIANEGAGHLEGKAIASFNLGRLESLLKKNIWVKDAELFFDNNLVLHVNIYEREPIARVFAGNGSSFYIDSSGFRMPLSNKMVVKLPVFTGFTPGNAALTGADSTLLKDVKNVAYFIQKNEFWMAQIAQVDILPDGNFEMVPTVGNHIIQFGNGDDVETKFKRLFIFYRQVLGPAGFDKYIRLNVQYDQQLVATRQGPVTKSDSMLAAKNIERMIREAGIKVEDSSKMSAKPSGTHQPKDSSHSEKENIRHTTTKEPSEMKTSTIRTNKPVITSPVEKSPSLAPAAKPKALMRKIEPQE